MCVCVCVFLTCSGLVTSPGCISSSFLLLRISKPSMKATSKRCVAKFNKDDLNLFIVFHIFVEHPNPLTPGPEIAQVIVVEKNETKQIFLKYAFDVQHKQ